MGILVLSALTLLLVSISSGDEACSIIVDATNNITMPDIAPAGSFQSQLELNFLETNTTMEIEEYFDFHRGMEKMKVLGSKANGVFGFQAIFNYKKKEIYLIKDSWECQTFTMPPEVHLEGTPNIPHIYPNIILDGFGPLMSIAGTFRMLRNFDRVKVNDDPRVQVRGVPSDHWKSCANVEGEKFSVDYYFSDEHWNHPVMSGQALLRIVTKGTQESQPFERYHDFLTFRPLVLDPNHAIFQLPPNVMCKGMKSEKSLPKLPDQYSFRMEYTLTSLKSEFNMVQYRDIWYDYKDQLIRFDQGLLYRNGTRRPITEIHDFNTGVRYVIDRLSGECSITGLKNSSDEIYDPSQIHTDQAHVYKMRSPMELFDLTEEYVYVGTETVRGIKCDAFIAELHYDPAGPTKSRFEYFFLVDTWFEDTNTGSKTSKGVPIKLRVTNRLSKYEVVYHYYDFSTNAPDISVFDISSCYPEAAKKHITVEFPGPYYGVVDVDMPGFLKTFRSTASVAGIVSFIRIQNIDVEYKTDSNSIFVSFSLLQEAPITAEFDSGHKKRMNATWPHEIKEQVYNLVECMESCHEQSKINCNSFDFNPMLGHCWMYQEHGGAKNLIDSKDWKHYSRIVNAAPYHEKTLKGAWMDIRNDVYEGSFKVIMMRKDHSGYHAYVAKSVRDDTVKEDYGYQPDDAMIRFKRLDGDKKLRPKYSKTFSVDTSVDECAERCLMEKSFQCSSFSYCYHASDVINRCLISSAHPEFNTTILTEEIGCHVHSRHYLDEYNRFDGFIGLTVDKTYQTVKQRVEDCALECTKSDKHGCNSFYFCLNSNRDEPTCFTSSERTPGYSDPGYGESQVCEFYSKSYLKDFAAVGKARVTSLTDGILLDNLSIEKCMDQCIQLLGSDKCSDVEYCPADDKPAKCFLPAPPSSGYKYSGKGKVEAMCQHYKRNITVTPTVKPTNDTKDPTSGKQVKDETHDQQESHGPESGGHSTGSMAAVGISMLIVGALIGVALYWALNRAKAKQARDQELQNLPSKMEMSQTKA